MTHVTDVPAAIAAMGRSWLPMVPCCWRCRTSGRCVFVPGDDPAADLWQQWWFALGRARGVSYDVFDRTPGLLTAAGFAIERSDRFQPVSTLPEAKTLPALGFEQCVPGYLKHDRAGLGGNSDQMCQQIVERWGDVVPLGE